MSTTTKIEWTDTTWNPTSGCTKVSPGCAHCYIERTPPFRIGKRPFEGGTGEHGIGATTGVVLHPDRINEPLRWRKPRRVFVNSLSDLFHDDVPDGIIAWIWFVMTQTPQHNYQILTKRPARMAAWVKRWADLTGETQEFKGARGPAEVRVVHPSPRAELFAAMLEQWGEPPEGAAYPPFDWMEGVRWWPGVPGNVWLGVSVEDQERADLRIPKLLGTPAAVRFLSCEPLLGPVDLRTISAHTGEQWDVLDRQEAADADEEGGCSGSIDWVIAGGESGPGARPMHPDWARALRDQCVEAGVPFFFKQWGEWAPLDVARPTYTQIINHGHHWDELVTRVGKKRAGRLLDGREWNEMPGARA